ncbi:MAG: serine/threonine protein kinase, partial [Myxococcota bacterium]|nr:serine/threonine protein kinase [Myxococcota bacterium]
MEGAIAIGPFELHAPIGRGGMGEVWRGVHVAQDVPVALKVLRGERALSVGYVAAFRREAERMAALDHPAIVTILDFGVLPADAGARSGGRLVGGSPYLAMELAEGGALTAPLAWPEVASVMRVLLDALAHAHARGVIHRDLKPANVLVSHCADRSRADVLLTDFGIAHAQGSDSPADQRDGELIGTPGFMAPEQVRGDWRDLGPWTDLYALGCVAWSLLAGAPPFDGETPAQILFRQLTHELPRLPAHVAVPEGAQAWIDRLACVSPRARFRR